MTHEQKLMFLLDQLRHVIDRMRLEQEVEIAQLKADIAELNSKLGEK